MVTFRADEGHLISVICETSAWLKHAGAEYWPDWLDEIAERMRVGHRGAITALLEGYGGMGSFNDLYLCSHNGHRVLPADEEAVNERFDALRAELYKRATSLSAGFRPLA